MELPIIRRDNDFESTEESTTVDLSISSGIFKEKATRTEWLGESYLSRSMEQSQAFACRRKIASDIYAFYGVITPKAELSKQKFVNLDPVLLKQKPGHKDIEGIYLMSKVIPDFMTYKEFGGKDFNISCPNLDQKLRSENSERILPERGFGSSPCCCYLLQ